MTGEGMGRRVRVGGDEHDAYGRFRKYITAFGRPGYTAAIKRRTHKRERRAAARNIQTERNTQWTPTT